MDNTKIVKQTVLFGSTLIVVGIAAYLITGRQSVTALIPSFVGIPVTLLAIFAAKSGKGTLFCSIAAVLTLLGLGGCIPGLLKIVPLLSGAEIARPAAVIVQSIMGILSIIYLILFIRSRFKK